MAHEPIVVNTPVSKEEEERILQEERSWSGPRYIILAAVTLAISLTVLYTMSSTTAEVPYPNFLLP